MNPTTQPEAQSPGKWGRLAWLPIPLLLAAIIAARLAGLRDTYESHTLLLFLSFTFYTLVSLGTLYLIGRSFLALGSPGLLLLECGVVLWSLAGTVGDFVSHGDANINVTIFNTGILLAGLCHLAGAILGLSPQRVLRAKLVWLGAGFVFALGALWLVSRAALSGWLPVFFIPGHGGTLVRYCVLISAIAMFVLAAGLLHATQRAARLPFTSWYALALLLLGVGLFGVMIQLSLGSLVNWLSRTAQWLGGLYLFFAAIASLRESQLPLLPLGKKLHPAYYREAVALAVVLAAAAIRLSFLSPLGMQAPFVTFYPAVMLASLYGGLRAGLLATVLSAVFVDYFWIEPVGQFTIGQPSGWLAIMTFVLSGAMIAWVSDAIRLARARASETEAQAALAAERTAAAEAMQEGRAKLEAALASMTDAVFISDVQGRFIDFNDAFATFHKFRNKDECAKTLAEYPDILDVFMPDGTLAPIDMWAVPRALRGETVTNAEYTLRRKDTRETWVGSYSFGPIRDKNGAIVGSVVVGRDITERKRAEEAIQAALDLFYLALSNTTFAALLVSEDNRVDFANQAFCDIFKLKDSPADLKTITSREMLEKIRFAYLNPEEDLAHIVEIVDRGLLVQDEEIPMQGGRTFLRDFIPIRLGNKKYGRLWIHKDITDRKRAEEELRRSRDELEIRVQERTTELEKANKTLQELSSRLLSAQEEERKRIAGEIHDTLGACLSAIKFKVEGAVQQIAGTVPVATQSFGTILPVIQEGIEECRRMQQDLRPSLLDDLGLLPTLSWYCRRYQTIYTGIKVDLEQTLEESDIPNALKIVIFRMTQEGMNNIAKHSKADLVRLSLGKMDGRIELVIEDNGQGFDLRRVLGSESTKKGLGLTSMRERTELSGGSFDVKSVEGKGTIIRASWPLCKDG